MSDNMMSPGSMIGKYEVVRKIGEGGGAIVYLVHCNKYDIYFAAKMLKYKRSHDELELATHLGLSHTHLINLYDYFYHQGKLILLLDYCEKGSLDDLIRSSGPLPPPYFFRTSQEILGAVKEMHSCNFAHRDIKPSNILIDSYGHIKIADYGLSLNFTPCCDFSCSHLFASPQLLRREIHDPFAADIWALGITFHYLLTGKYPYDIKSPKLQMAIMSGLPIIDDNIPRQLYQMICQMLQFNPNFRPTIQALLEMPFWNSDSPKPADRAVDLGSISVSRISRSLEARAFLQPHFTHREQRSKAWFNKKSSTRRSALLRPTFGQFCNA